MNKIPLVDLTYQYNKLGNKIINSIKHIAKSNHFINGLEVELFEKNFAKFCKVKYCVGVGNGTVAIHAALSALGITIGDEVITVPNTFIATSEAITQTGAKVVFCDIDLKTLTMDPQSVIKKITKRTKALLPVHIHGNPCQMDQLRKLAKKYKLFIIEDAAQAHGAEYKNLRIGNWGDMATFSFFPAKNLGAWGDAGAVVTNNQLLYERTKALINHGRREKYIHDFEGYNYRLDTIQAAILNIKLPYLEKWNMLRRQHARLYCKLLQKISGIEIVQEMPGGKSAYHLLVICHPKRDKIKKYLFKIGVETGVHYPLPLHLQPAYKYLGYKKGDLPIAEKIADNILSLPMYPELKDEQIKYICKSIKEAIS